MSQVANFAADVEGDVFALRTNHELMERKALQTVWQVFGSGVTRWGLDDPGNLIISLTNNVIKQAPTDITNANGSGIWSTGGSSPVTTANGDIWYLGLDKDVHSDHSIHHIRNQKVKLLPGTTSRLILADGVVWAFHWSAFAPPVLRFDGTTWVQQISLRAADGIWFLGVSKANTLGDHPIYRFAYDSGLVTKMPGAAVSLSVYYPEVYALTATGNIQRWNGAAWQTQKSYRAPQGDRFFNAPNAPYDYDVTLRWVDNHLTNAGIQATAFGYAGNLLWAFSQGGVSGDLGSVSHWDGTKWVSHATFLANDGSTCFLSPFKADALGNYFVYRFKNGLLTVMPASAALLTNDRNSHFFATTAAGLVMTWTGTAWAKQATVKSADGSVFVLVGTNLFRTAAGAPLGQWRLFGSANKFAIDPTDNSVLAVLVNSLIKKAPAATVDGSGLGLWTTLGAWALVAPDGSVWFLDHAAGQTPYPIYRIADNRLMKMPGTAGSLGIAENAVWAFSRLQYGAASRWNGTAWIQQPSVFGVEGLWFLGAGKVDALGNHPIYLSNSSDSSIVRMPGAGISLSTYGGTWTLTASGVVQRWNGAAWITEKSLVPPSGGRFFRDPSNSGIVVRWAAGNLVGTGITATGLALIGGNLWAANAGGVFRWSGTAWVAWQTAITPDGGAWFLLPETADVLGNHALYRFLNGQLTKMPGLFQSLLTSSGDLWAADSYQRVWRWNATKWELQPTVLGPDGTVWLLGLADEGGGDHKILHLYKGRLGQMPGYGSKLIRLENSIWAFSASGKPVSHWDGAEWVNVPTGIGADGALWFLGKTAIDAKGNHAIYRWNGTLTRMPGAATTLISVGTDLWMLDADGKVWRWNGAAWGQVGDHMKTLVRSGSVPYAQNSVGQVVRYYQSAWEVVANSTITAQNGAVWFLGIDVIQPNGNHGVYAMEKGFAWQVGYATSVGGAEGAIWISNADHEVLRWNGSYFDGGLSGIVNRVVAADGSTWFLADGAGDGLGQHQVVRISSSGQFTTMPGRVARLVGTAEGTVWALSATNQVLRWNGTDWSQQPSAVFDDSLHGGVWCLGALASAYGDRLIYRIPHAGQLTLMPYFAATLLSTLSNRILLAVNAATNQALRWSNGWVNVTTVVPPSGGSLLFRGGNTVFLWKSGTAQAILSDVVGFASLEGTAWAADSAKKVWRWNGAIWSPQTAVSTLDGAIWFLGTNNNGQGDRSVYRWSDGQATSMPGAATGLWVASGIIWSIDAGKQLRKWENGAWSVQAALTPSSDGSFSLTGDDELAIKLVDYIAANGSLGAQVAKAMPYIQNLQKVAVYDPTAAFSQNIMKHYATEGDAKLKAAIKSTIDSQYAAHAYIADYFGNGKWGHKKTRSIWDGFNADGTGHYRQQDLNSGYWQRGGVDKPVIEKAEVSFRSFDPNRKAWIYHVAVVIDVRGWIEAKEWSWGAELFHASLSGHIRTSVSFDVAIKLEHTFSLASMHLKAGVAAEIYNLDYSIIADFGKTAPGNWLANQFIAIPFNTVVNSGWAHLMVDSAVAKSVGYFHSFGLDAGFTSGFGSKVKVSLFHNGVLKASQTI